jgi:iron-sulfur cluster repair protein YtfE (RIC family)
VAAVLTHWDASTDPNAADFEETHSRLGVLRAELAEHFSEEEQEGYLSGALSAAPRFSRWAIQLRKQHEEFLEELDRLTRNLRSEEPESWKETRSDFERLADQIRRHEGAENAIVQASAFGDDVGARGLTCRFVCRGIGSCAGSVLVVSSGANCLLRLG